MIKRRFYKVEHGDRDDPSASSSSSSDSEVEAEAAEDSEVGSVGEVHEEPDHSSTSSGSLVDEDDSETEEQILSPSPLPSKLHRKTKDRDPETAEKDDAIPSDALAYVLKCKSVFKCRICPRIVCLNVDSLKAHLKSKRHVRSEKLLNDGRLKSMLNSDGEVEDQETASEMNTRIVSWARDNPTKEKKGKQRLSKRCRKKAMEAESGLEDAKQACKNSSKKQRGK